jgi:3-methyladenine DNA glycosylase Tag
MERYQNYADPNELNPYAVAPARSDFMSTQQRQHDSGNALAANSEARVIASVKAQVFMAKQFPRDPSLAMAKILEECKRPTLAETAVYTFPRGKETVTGPSIRLAEVLARNFGNMTFGYEVLDRKAGRGSTPGVSVIRAYAWDFETNLMIDRQFEVKHYRSTRSGGYALTDDRDIYELEANMSSRRIRACILQMIPGDVTDAAVAACRQTAASGISQLMADPKKRAATVKATIRVYEKMGVNQEDLEAFLNAKADDWTADHMLRLKETKTSLEDANASLGEYFPRLAVENQDDTITKDQVKALMEAAKATGLQGRISAEMKKLGIAKFADVPAGKFDEIMALINGLADQEAQVPQDLEPERVRKEPEPPTA